MSTNIVDVSTLGDPMALDGKKSSGKLVLVTGGSRGIGAGMFPPIRG